MYAIVEVSVELCRRRAIGPDGGLHWGGGIPAGLAMGAAAYEAHARFTFRGLHLRVGLLEGLLRNQAFYWLGLLVYGLALRLQVWADASLVCAVLAKYPLVSRYVFHAEATRLVSSGGVDGDDMR